MSRAETQERDGSGQDGRIVGATGEGRGEVGASLRSRWSDGGSETNRKHNLAGARALGNESVGVESRADVLTRPYLSRGRRRGSPRGGTTRGSCTWPRVECAGVTEVDSTITATAVVETTRRWRDALRTSSPASRSFTSGPREIPAAHGPRIRRTEPQTTATERGATPCCAQRSARRGVFGVQWKSAPPGNLTWERKYLGLRRASYWTPGTGRLNEFQYGVRDFEAFMTPSARSITRNCFMTATRE